MSFLRALELKIRRYEHARWSAEDDRRTLPFSWGLEHLGGNAREPNPRAFLTQYSDNAIARSDDWFATGPASDYRLADNVLTFTSGIASPFPENNLVHARFFPARKSGPAVVVIPQWNGDWDAHANVCRFLNSLGISALRMTLPYHDRRAVPGHLRADHLVGPNLGLTLQANRQAVTDARRCLRWLESRGYGKLGILGTSIGSSVAFITMAHDPAIRAGTFLHVSTYFGEVVRTGMTTMHVWEGLRAQVSPEELRHWWAPISPYPYMHRVKDTGQRMLLISGDFDPTFWPEFSQDAFDLLRHLGIDFELLRLPCGHYSLGVFPFGHIAALRFGAFLFRSLS